MARKLLRFFGHIKYPDIELLVTFDLEDPVIKSTGVVLLQVQVIFNTEKAIGSSANGDEALRIRFTFNLVCKSN